MIKRKTLILIGAAVLLVLVLLALVLRGRAQAVVFGLLFIVGFVGIFGGLILGLNALNERYFLRPRNPTHLCDHCHSLYQDPEEEICTYCLETFGLQKPLFPLPKFIQEHSRADLQARLKALEVEHGKARGRNILFIEHDMKSLKRILRIQAERQSSPPETQA